MMTKTPKTLRFALLIGLLLGSILPAMAQRHSTPSPPVRLEPPMHCCNGLPMPERPIAPKGYPGNINPVPPAGSPHATPAPAKSGTVPPHAAKIGDSNSAGGVVGNNGRVLDPPPPERQHSNTGNDPGNASGGVVENGGRVLDPPPPKR